MWSQSQSTDMYRFLSTCEMLVSVGDTFVSTFDMCVSSCLSDTSHSLWEITNLHGGATLKFCTKATQDSKDLKNHFLLSRREELTFSSLFCEEEMGVWVNLKSSFFFFFKTWIIKQKNKQGTKNKTHNNRNNNNNNKTRSLPAQSKAIIYVTGNSDDHSIYSLPINKRNTKRRKNSHHLASFGWLWPY